MNAAGLSVEVNPFVPESNTLTVKDISDSTILLATARIQGRDATAKFINLRALIDPEP